MFAVRRAKFAFRGAFFPIAIVAMSSSLLSYARPYAGQASQPSATTPGQVMRSVGTIKGISGNTITLTPDAGAEINVVVQDSTRLLRIPPGEKTLKNATPVQLQDLQPGDRILAGGKLGDDSKSLNASTIVVMKQADVAAKQQQERDEWQKRGMSGLVTAADPAAGTVTISQPSLSGPKVITIHTTKTTAVRRYAPDSVKFEDAKPGTLADIKPGDQVRALGSPSADGSALDAEVIVSGTFRNLAGSVISTDAAANTVTILDLMTKKPVVVKISPDSQLHKLPAMMAQRMAMRLKGGANGAPGASGAPAAGGSSGASASPSAPASRGGMTERSYGSGAPDLQQIIARTPPVAISDLQKGDAVMILSTEGTPSGGVTAITLVAGVEPILQSSSKASQAMVLSPWSLGGGGAGGDAESQ